MRRIFVILAAAVTLAACSEQAPEVRVQDQVPAAQRTQSPTEDGGAAQGSAAEAESTTWVAVDLEFTSAPDTVPAGELTVTLVNEGQAPHDVTFVELGDETVVTAEPGQRAEGTVTLPPGSYTYYCSVPGHRAAGMEGRLTAE